MKRIERRIDVGDRHAIFATAEYDEDVNHQFRYHVTTNDGDDIWFRYDDGWRVLLDGERSTVDREHLLGDRNWYDVTKEPLGEVDEDQLPDTIRQLLDDLRKL